MTFLSSTNTSTTRPIILARRSVACFRFSSLMRLSRSCFVSSSSWFSHVAAGVFGRGEYAAVLTESNFTRSIMSSVSRKSCSVSPGKPTIT